jgi:hypothetical protein
MGPIGAFFRRMSRRRRIGMAVAALAIALAAVLASIRSRETAPDPSSVDGLDPQTAPASGAPPEAGGEADIIPPDEGGDEAGSGDTPNAGTADIPVPEP